MQELLEYPLTSSITNNLHNACKCLLSNVPIYTSVYLPKTHSHFLKKATQTGCTSVSAIIKTIGKLGKV